MQPNAATSEVPASIDIGGDDKVRLSLSWSDPDEGWLLYLYEGDEHIGKLGCAACPQCRVGEVLKISAYSPHDRSGVRNQLACWEASRRSC